MRGWWPIFKRELFAFFVTPLAWVVMTAFLLLQGLHFYLLVAHFAAQVDLTDITLRERATRRFLWQGESVGSVVRRVSIEEASGPMAAHAWADQALKSAVSRMAAGVTAASFGMPSTGR